MSSSSSSCSHWWHAPVYIAATASLIIAAISSSFPPLHNLATSDDDLILALHRSGFHLAAITLHLSAAHLPPSSTIFALPDSALSNLSLPAADFLLRYHTAPLSLPFSTLAAMPRGASIPTLLPNKHLSVLTPPSSNASSSAVAINGVPISHPDLFARGPHVVHGVSAPFPTSYEPETSAAANSSVRWGRVARVLGSKGYVSFSLGLSSVLDSLPPLDQATVFAPRDSGSGFHYVAQPANVLERALRRHMAVGRFGYGELVEMKVGEEMRTLEKDWGIMITGGDGNKLVEVNWVEITEAEVLVDDGVAVHGIAMAFGGESESETLGI